MLLHKEAFAESSFYSGTYGVWGRAWFPVDAVVVAALCVVGVALMALHWLWWGATLHHLLCPFFFLCAASTTFSDY